MKRIGLALLALTGCSALRGPEGTVGGDCADGADNDQDGAFDCKDDGCSGSPDCAEDSGNHAPEGPVVAIEPTAPTAGDALTCSITSLSADPDGDPLTYRFVWTRDGADAGIASAQVPEDTTHTNETWTCYVTPNDGALDGVTGTASVTIAPPEIPALDIVLVMDNSSSMQQEASSLADAMDELASGLASVGVTDWRIGITTTSVIFSGGPTSGIDPGEGGRFFNGTMLTDPEDAREVLLCDATCWSSSSLPSDPSYACGDPLDGDVTVDYLDCICGAGSWQGNCGSGLEQGLEAGFLALCRGAEAPPDACYSFPPSAAVAFEPGDERSNAGIRADATQLILIVSDEGDGSLRTSDPNDDASTGEVDGVASTYAALFDAFPSTARVGVFGPSWDGTDASCLDGAQPWSVERYESVTVLTDGFYEELKVPQDDCAPREFDTLFSAAIADLWG